MLETNQANEGRKLVEEDCWKSEEQDQEKLHKAETVDGG